MKTILIFILFSASFCFAQQICSTKNDNAYVFKIIPSAKDNIYGVCIGIVGSEAVCNLPNVKNSHGINIQIIDQGLFVLLNRKAFSYSNTLADDTGYLINLPDSSSYKAWHNGLILSSFGTFTDVISGVSFSCGSSIGFLMNGVSFNLISNKYSRANGITLGMINQANHMTGLQIGLFNKTSHLKGFQFGLWNVNSKRKLPLINWSFN